MLVAGGVEPGVIEKILGAVEAGPVGEEEEFRRDERRGVLAVRRDDIGDARPAGGDGQHPDIGEIVALRMEIAPI